LAIFNIKIFKKKTFFLILIAAGISFSPRFSCGVIAGNRRIDIRIEDILLVIFGINWIFNFSIKNQLKPPLLLPILSWISFGFFTTLINLFLGNLNITRAFFYYLKEIEYFFLYFYVFYHIEDINSIVNIIKSWLIFGAVNIGWIIFQILTKNPMGEYRWGVHYLSAIGESGLFPVTGFFLILFINLFSIFLFCHHKFSKLEKFFYGIINAGLVLGIVSMMRRICIITFILAFFILFFIYIIRMKKFGFKNYLTFLLFLIITIIFISLPFVKNVSIRPEFFNWERIINWEIKGRIDIWKKQLKNAFPEGENPLYIFFGKGKSVSYEECHSQYIRNLVETGGIGSIIFLILIFTILKKSYTALCSQKDPLKVALSAGTLISTIAMLIISILGEAFITVKINEVYWFFVGITMSILSFNRNGRAQNKI